MYAFFQNDITSETMLKLTNQVEDLNPAHLFLLIATGGWHSCENVFISSQEALEHKIATSQQPIQIPRNAKIIKI